MTNNPCTACSWSSERQRNCSYESDVKLVHASRNRGIWAIGSSLILKDRGPMHRTYEVFNAHLVRESTTIPVPTVIGSWKENRRTFILMKRIPGESLRELWPRLSLKEKESIAKQTADYISQLRGLQNQKIQGVGGRPIYSSLLFPYKRADNPFPPHGPFSSDDELWADMGLGITNNHPKSMNEDLRRVMPPGRPYTFTHCNLAIENIMVEDGKVTGILDWECSGYYPVWWEYVCTSAATSQEDQEWKALLRKQMRDYTRARDWWSTYCMTEKDDESERLIRDDTQSERMADSDSDGSIEVERRYSF
ncbi:kinase-like protein [Aspergillus sclerotioniger CBS 115572]|uniref:Kinase-like protein n=1 Tax=Aspergillus sclerotioniger CBS 115572 TaxID=1450535 RepID=A0A317VFG4_9EURO|nr:kinase-like protein [Aspergillus sclerotioniger CBS 115572]PWY72209.1 kinase-like protein [Aspergillus sclerotioniger CBS 115572]